MIIYPPKPNGALEVVITKKGEPSYPFAVTEISRINFKTWLINELEGIIIKSSIANIQHTVVVMKDDEGVFSIVFHVLLSTSQLYTLIYNKITAEYTPNDADYEG